MSIEVTHDPEALRFRATIDDDPAGYLAYSLSDETWTTYTTQVVPAFEGRGVGSSLARAASESARAANLKINPTCWFVAGWLDRHPEFESVRA